MKLFYLYLPIFFLALLQGAFLPLNLILLVVLFAATFYSFRESYWLAFGGGIMLDLAKGTPLGFSSLLFLLAAGWVRLYSRRFDPAHPLFLPALTLVNSLMFDRITSGGWHGRAAIILTIGAVFGRFLILRFFGHTIGKQLRLS